jgi:hypothetical protein
MVSDGHVRVLQDLRDNLRRLAGFDQRRRERMPQ